MSISVGGVIEIQAAITKDSQYSCDSEIYCACSSIIHKGTQNPRDNLFNPLRVRFLPVSAT